MNQDKPDKGVNSIDAAIQECQIQVKEYQRNIRLLMATFLGTIVLISTLLISLYPKIKLGDVTGEKMVIGGMALFVVVFGVVTALYRFLLLEISRVQGYKLGFMRIRIAANNHADEFGTEVRRALTEKCFENSKANKKEAKVESPLPGHPGSDISAIVLSKLLEGIEVVSKEKTKANKN